MDLETSAGITPGMLDGGLAEDLATAALAMARRFAAGGTLWCVAPSWEPHAHHVAVEFVHPVIVGKRALPAFALTGPGLVAQAQVAVRPGDILIAVAAGTDPDVGALMRQAPGWGATSVWIGWGPRPSAGAADHVLWIDDPDLMTPATGRFVHLYHVLWELAHVCFEHPGLLAGREPLAAREPQPAGFLYPFIDPPLVSAPRAGSSPVAPAPADAAVGGTEALLAELATSARAKAAESAALQQATLAASADRVTAAGAAMAERFTVGGRMYAFGNGGSSTDCATFAMLFASPPAAAPGAPGAPSTTGTGHPGDTGTGHPGDTGTGHPGTTGTGHPGDTGTGHPGTTGTRHPGTTGSGHPAGSEADREVGSPAAYRALPALNLAADQAVVTALGNDVGFDLVFSRQIIAHAASMDIAVAFSTSGNSRDLMAALREARGRGLLTVGFAGYEGGEMATSGDVEHCFVVRSQSIHRIQESQALLGYHLWAATQRAL